VLASGTEIRGYRIERLLGRGGMGEVYEATQLGLGRRVAFKVLHTRLGGDDDFRERFRREGQLQAALEHPNVVTVHEAGELDDGGLFLAMRLVDGPTLKQLIVAGELDAERTLRILAPIAAALDAAHGSGLVHRDVKPQNILVGDGDHPFLADFGLTRGQDQSGVTRSGQFVGTIDYIAPEQVRGEPAGPASDRYALAGTLHECLTGSVPYPRPSDAAVLFAHVNDPPPKASDLHPSLPPAVDAVLARGLAKEPEDRHATARDLVAAATEALGDDPAAAGARPPRRDAVAHGVRAVEGETADGDVPPPPATATAPRERTPATVAARSGRRRSAASGAIAAGLAVVALAGVAFVAGRAIGGDSPPPLANPIASDAVALRAPAGWEPTAAAERPAIPGLALDDDIGTAPADRDGSGIMAGMTAADGPTLLPGTLAARVPEGLPKPTAVELGDLAALRYRDVAVRGFDRRLTLYASPTSAGTATVACYAPSAEAAADEPTCEAVAQTLELLEGRPYPLAVPAAAERALDRTARRLDRARRDGRRRLAEASQPAGQAKAARALERAYGTAARDLRAVDAGPALAGSIGDAASAAAGAGRAYGRLAAAVDAGDPGAYDAARSAVRSAEARTERALAAIAAASRPAGGADR
jgi:hypothetical protein